MIRVLFTVILLTLAPWSVPADTLVFGDTPQADFQPLAEGVWAQVQREDHRFQDCNTTIIDHPELGLVLVDPPAGAEASRRLLTGLLGLGDAPVGFIILTHFHGDHTQGSAVIKDAFPGARIVGHQSLREDIPERAEKDHQTRVQRLQTAIPAAEEQLNSGKNPKGEPYSKEQLAQEWSFIARAKAWLESNAEARFLVPDLTYEKTLTLGSEAFPILLKHFAGHTRGDTVVYLPRQKVLAAGDLVDAMPYAGHGFPRQWREALLEVDDWAVEHTVPGHGPVYEGHGQNKRLQGFFFALVDAAEKARRAGVTLDELQQNPPQGLRQWRNTLAGEDPAAQRFFDGALGENLQAAWKGLNTIGGS